MFIKVILNKKSLAFLTLAAVGIFLIFSVWQRVKTPQTVKAENNQQIVDYLAQHSVSVKEQPVYKKEIEITHQLVIKYPSLEPYYAQTASAVVYDVNDLAADQRAIVFLVREGIVMHSVYKLQNTAQTAGLKN